jgi:hypothetical protein
MSKHEIIEIQGSGGGGKSGGTTTADNLQSRAVARFTDLISEGQIVGLVNGAKSIYFNETPLQNDDNTFNFDNVVWQERKGLPDDEHISGNSAVEQVTAVEVKVGASSGPVQRTITAPDADAIRVVMRLNSLFLIDDKGNSKNNTVSYAIDVRPVGGAWVRKVWKEIKDRKTTSPTQIAHRIELPTGSTSWDVRVTRGLPDDADEKHQSVIYWESYVTLIEGRFTYPHSALVAMEVNAEDLGTSIPNRSYRVKGRIINVPSNYNTTTLTYAGIWDGTFKLAWTDEPAWIFYDLIENDRYGVGEFVDRTQIDKWGLYEIAKYNSGLVKSGFKDANGIDIMERRHTFNGVIRDREDAYFALQKITTAWRGMGYWAIGQYFATSDKPADPVKLVTPANVIGGEFIYSSTSMKSRHNVALVNWNDPDNHFKPTPEVEILDEYMQKNGWRETRVDLTGCTSRGLALRYARWLLDTENTATETVTYSASFDHADIRPGDIIAIADPRRALVRMGGRVVAHTANTVTLDSDISLLGGSTYQIYLTNTDGSLQTLNITSRLSAGVYATQSTTKIVDPGSVFIVTGTDVAPRQFRVITISETEANVFSISALSHDPNKYARVENGFNAVAPSYARERPVSPPTNVTQKQENYIEAGVTKSKVSLSWTPPEGVIVRNYIIFATSSSSGKTPVATTQETSIDITGLDADSYTFEIVTVDRLGAQSQPASVSVTVVGSAGLSTLVVTNVESTGSSSSSFEGGNATITWKNVFPASSNSTATVESSPLYRNNIIEIRDPILNTLLRTVTVSGNTFTYTLDANKADSLAKGFTSARRSLKFLVKLVDVNNNQSPFVSAIITNPAPSVSIPVATADGVEVSVKWANPIDQDYKGTLIWMKKTAINTAVDLPAFDGLGGVATLLGDATSTYNIVIGHYDLFGKTDMFYSSPITVTTGIDRLSTVEGQTAAANTKADSAINAANAATSLIGAVSSDFDALETSVASQLTSVNSTISTLNSTVSTNAAAATAANTAEATTRASADLAISTYAQNIESVLSTNSGVLIETFLDATIPRVNSGGVYAVTANEVHKLGSTISLTVTTVQEDGLYINSASPALWNGVQNADAYVLEADFTLVSGNLTGAGFVCNWNSTTTPFSTFTKFADCLSAPLVLGKLMTARTLVKRPAGFTGTFASQSVYLMANWAGFGGLAAKSIKFHRWQVRPATAEEIKTGVLENSLNTLTATVTNDIYTKTAANAAIATAKSEVQASVTDLSASVTQNTNAVATINGNAAASYVLRAVAGSAAASLEFIAADNPVSGVASTAKLAAKHFEVTAESMRITGGVGSAVNLDPNFQDASAWTGGQVAVAPIGSITGGVSGDKGLIGLPGVTTQYGSRFSPVNSSKRYRLRASFLRTADGSGSSFMWVMYYNSSFVFVSATPTETITPTTAWTETQVAGLVPPAGAAYAKIFFQLNTGTVGNHYVQGAYLEEQISSTLIVDGSITANHLAVGSITADKMNVEWLNAGRISAAYLDVNSLLTIQQNAGFKYVKNSVTDDANDGVYLGVDTFAGATRFGFAASRTSSAGKKQSLKLSSSTGLLLSNAKHVVSGLSAPTNVTITANTGKTYLGAGAKTLKIEAVGGGASGQSGYNSGTNNVSFLGTANVAGENTVINVYDGTTLRAQYVAAGGSGASGSINGNTSAYGNGIAQGGNGVTGQRWQGSPSNGGWVSASTLGGNAGNYISIDAIDISGYANPQIEIIVGGGGVATPSQTTASNGTSGRAIYHVTFAEEIPADVVPLKPTASGSFANPGSGGIINFPDLGAGLWVIWSSATSLNMNYISQSNGYSITGWPNEMTFFSSKTPAFQPMTAACTIYYNFYSMGNWG